MLYCAKRRKEKKGSYKMWVPLISVLLIALHASAAQVSYISGTCMEAAASYNLSNFYNEAAVAASAGGTKCSPPSTPVDTPDWDLGKDGAFTNFSILFCSFGNNGYSFPFFISIIEQKGFKVTQSCDLAGLLSYPKFAVFVIMDSTTTLYLTDADTTAARNFYMAGGGVFATTDDCPYFMNVNAMFDKFPDPFKGFRLRYSDGLSGMTLSCGNPLGYNSFGYHVTYTGILSMNAGYSLSIPTYYGNYGVGPFGVMGTCGIASLSDCTSIPCAPYCGGTPPSGSHAVQMYVDPLIQLVNVSNSGCWGRIVVDSGWTRYYYQERYGSTRFGVNIVVWLVNIDKYFSTKSQCPGAPTPAPPTSSNTTNTSLQVLGCSSGDAITLTAPIPPCGVTFAGPDAPKCLAIIVGDNGTTCIVNLKNAQVGTYWILVDGMNSSLQFSVTASSLIPRGSVISATLPCVMSSSTVLSGCMDGATIVIDWTLPGAEKLTLGVLSSVSICAPGSFSFVATQVTCKLAGLWNFTRGQYQTYINGVSTGISMQVASNKAPPKSKRCSDTHTMSPTPHDSKTRTLTVSQARSRTVSSTMTQGLSTTFSASDKATRSLSVTASASATMSATPNSSFSGTPSKTLTPSSSPSPSVTTTATDTVTETLSLPYTMTLLLTLSREATDTERVTRTASVHITRSRESTITRTRNSTHTRSRSATPRIACVESAAIEAAMGLLLGQQLFVTAGDIVGGYYYETTLVSDVMLENSSFHLWWFTPIELTMTVTLGTIDGLAENSDGFKQHLGTSANITVAFPEGLVSRTGSDSVVVALTIPPIPSYAIEAEEMVHLLVSPQNLTYAPLCPTNYSNTKSVASAAGLLLFDMTIYPPLSQTALSAQSVVSVLAPISAALAAPQLSVLVMTAMLPCSSTYTRGALANYRALAPTAISNSFEGVVIGNLILSLGFFVLWSAVAWIVSVTTKVDFGDACAQVRHPSLPIIVYFLTFPGTSFATMQLLTDATTPVASLALAGATMVVVLLSIPVGTMHYIKNYIEMDFESFDYARWHRNSSPLVARFLNVILLPVGAWTPQPMYKMYWMFITRQCRREYLWLTLPLWSPVVVAGLGVIRPGSLVSCAILFAVLAFLHLIIALVVVWFRPLQSTLEDIIFVTQTFLTALVLSFSASLLLLPGSAALRTGMVVLAFCIIVVTAIDILYNIALFSVIMPRLYQYVPHTHAFSWPLLPDGEEGEMDEEMRERQRVFDLYNNDKEELLLGDDDPRDLRHLDDDDFLDALMVPHQDASLDPARKPAQATADDFLDGLLAKPLK